MISLIICAVIGLLIGDRVAKAGKKDKQARILRITMGGLAGLLVWLIIGGLFTAIFPYKVSVFEQEKTKIVISSDPVGTQGFIFLFLDEAGGEPYLKFTIKKFGEEEESKKIPVKGARILEENRENAYLAKEYGARIYPRWVYNWIYPKIKRRQKFFKSKVIHVPLGTIQIGHELNLE